MRQTRASTSPGFLGRPGRRGSGLEERLYYQTDANFNVTALVGEVEGSWVVVERYVYTPYGNPTIYDDDSSATVLDGCSVLELRGGG